MAKEKTPNYTPEMVAELTDGYKGAADRKGFMEKFAAAHGKSVASVRMKLVREKVYVKETPAKKVGKGRTTKADLVNQLEEKLGIHFHDESLEKATARVLKQLLESC